ncbi:hypothetical protein CHU98_g11888, partial [Xylaria longipes]
MSSLPTQIAETIQTAHIKREPSPRHDLNPSTAASTRQPAYLSPASPSSLRRYNNNNNNNNNNNDDDDDELDDDDEEEE